MKTENKILIAFVLNLIFSIFEFLGGIFTGSIAIISDAVHDIADAASIGISYFLEKKSRKQPDEQYTYGYARYSVLGAALTNLILILGSLMVVYNAVNRMITPTDIRYNGMIILAVIGVCVNFAAAWFTREGDSVNEKAVNLHMLEDVLGWLAVLAGSVIMKFTDFALMDPLLSIAIALMILIHGVKNLKQVLDIFLEKTPGGIRVHEIRAHLLELEGVLDVHHVHIWSLDGHNNYATLHLVVNTDPCVIKEKVRGELRQWGIGHVTLELEAAGTHCREETCFVKLPAQTCHGHHH